MGDQLPARHLSAAFGATRMTRQGAEPDRDGQVRIARSHQPGFDFAAIEAERLTPLPRFNGPAYAPAFDQARLTGQLARVWAVMKDGSWRTLSEIASATHDPESSISAQLRHLRKARFGGHTVDRRSRGERSSGLWEYRVQLKGKE